MSAPELCDCGELQDFCKNDGVGHVHRHVTRAMTRQGYVEVTHSICSLPKVKCSRFSYGTYERRSGKGTERKPRWWLPEANALDIVQDLLRRDRAFSGDCLLRSIVTMRLLRDGIEFGLQTQEARKQYERRLRLEVLGEMPKENQEESHAPA